ncbi:MAG: ArnT family glycosyltransferase [Chitinophagaceae bacterium]
MNIFSPRIDRRNETNGITGSHFPLFEWQLACIYKLTGEHYYVARLYSTFIFSIAMLALYLILVQMGIRETTAIAGGLGLLSIPQFYYDSINAMPDIYALALSLLSAYYILRDSKQASNISILMATVFAIFAGLIKFQFLIIPLSFTAYQAFNPKNIARLSIYFSFILIPVILWYQYAIELTKLNNLKEFGLWIKPISLETKLNTFLNNLVSDTPELLIGYPVLIALMVLIFKRSFKLVNSSGIKLAIFWLAGFGAFYLIVIERMMHHSYYFMAILPLVVIVLVKGVVNQGWHIKYLYIIILLNFVWSGLRIIPSRWSEGKQQIPEEFKNSNTLSAIRNSIPEGSLCLVGPDKSGCIYFYFTDTEGYSFEDPQELLSMKQEGQFMEVLERAGVKYVICDHSEEMDGIMQQLQEWREYKAIGAFKIWTHR